MTLNNSLIQPREGEQLDSTQLNAYLASEMPELRGNLSIKQFPGGHSNLTYLIQKGEKKMVLRRPPLGKKAKSAHDMGREFHVLSAISDAYPYCPAPISYCPDSSFSEPFYMMESIEGLIIRSEYPKELNLSERDIRRHSEILMKSLSDLHKLSLVSAPRSRDDPRLRMANSRLGLFR